MDIEFECVLARHQKISFNFKKIKWRFNNQLFCAIVSLLIVANIADFYFLTSVQGELKYLCREGLVHLDKDRPSDTFPDEKALLFIV